MSNVSTGNPWILDEAAVITTNLVHVDRMIYVPNAADNDLVVKGNDGGEVWRVRAIAASDAFQSVGQETFDTPMLMNGFNLATIDGGTLRVYLR